MFCKTKISRYFITFIYGNCSKVIQLFSPQKCTTLVFREELQIFQALFVCISPIQVDAICCLVPKISPSPITTTLVDSMVTFGGNVPIVATGVPYYVDVYSLHCSDHSILQQIMPHCVQSHLEGVIIKRSQCPSSAY